MRQVETLLFKNWLILKHSRRELLLILGLTIILSTLVAFLNNGSFYRKMPQQPAMPVFGIPFIDPSRPQPSARLVVAPSTNESRDFMRTVVQYLRMSGVQVNPTASVSFATNETMLDAQLRYLPNECYPSSPTSPSSEICFGVVLTSLAPPRFAYSLKTDYNLMPDTARFFLPGEEPRVCVDTRYENCPQAYFRTGFVTLQNAIDSAIIYHASNKYSTQNVPEGGGKLVFSSGNNEGEAFNGLVRFVRFGSRPEAMMQSLLPVMALVMPVAFALLPMLKYMTSTLVDEKNCGMKQLLVVLGMRMRSFLVSWLVPFGALLLLLTCAVTLVVSISVIPRSAVIFFWLTLAYSFCLFAMSFFFATLFDKTASASHFVIYFGLVTSMIYLIVPFTRQFPFEYDVPLAIIILLMPFPQFTYSLAVDLIFYAEIFRDGVNGDAVFTLGQIPAFYMLLVLLGEFVFYLLVGLFLEQTFSPEYGDHRLFVAAKLDRNRLETYCEDERHYPETDFEEPHPLWSPAIRIDGLWKVYKQSRKAVTKAVCGVKFDIYDGQITCILGHNGAGKSTLIGMMTGLLRPTRGTVTICGHDVRNPDDVRSMRGRLGICLQHSTCYERLTVREHLLVFAKLKNLENIDYSIDRVIEEVGLVASANVECRNLSGGQKRRLNLAMALIGDPKVIFLDEPTSGVDPVSRRAIWKLLEARKSRHVIVLTTHYMDEADLLADRKAILSRGTLRCAGSSFFLKNRFGTGYHLNVEMMESPNSLAPLADRNAKRCVMEFVRSLIEDATVREETLRTMSITLPFKDVSKLPELFDLLESPVKLSDGCMTTVAQQKRIKSFAIELTTLEEVFLRLAEESTSLPDTRRDDEEGEGEGISGAESSDAADRGAGDDRLLNVSADDVPDDEEENGPLDSGTGNSAFNDTSSTTSSTEARRADIGELNDLAVESRKPNVFRKWLTLLQLRLHMLVNDWLRTTVQLTLMTFVVTLLAIVYIVVARNRINLLQCCQPVTFSVDQYAAKRDSASKLPPLAYDSRSTVDVSLVQQLLPDTKVLDALISNDTFDTNIGLTAAEAGQKLISLWYGDTALHSPAVALNMLSNLRLGSFLPGMHIETSNSPISITGQQVSEDVPWSEVKFSLDDFVNLIPLGFMIVFVSIATNLQKEHQFGAFDQLRATGVNCGTYVSVQLFVNSIQYLIAFALAFLSIILVATAYGVTITYNVNVLIIDLMAFVCFIPPSFLMTYCVTFLMRRSSTALVAFVVTFMFFPMPIMANGIMVSQIYNIAGRESVIGPYWVCLLFPNLMLSCCLTITKYPTATRFPIVPSSFSEYFKSENLIVWSFVAGLVHTIILTVILRIIYKSIAERHTPFKLVSCRKPTDEELENAVVRSASFRQRHDSDVTIEEDYVDTAVNRSMSVSDSADSSTDGRVPLLICRNLRLAYKRRRFTGRRFETASKLAIQSLTFSVGESQIFGLLGPNGAGKTSTFRILVGSERPDLGDVYVSGQHVARLSVSELFDQVSICPQEDPLWPMLSVRNHLHYYAALRGFYGASRKRVVDTLLRVLEIGMHANKKCEHLSGGTKRKVIFAIAIMKTSRLRLILCDEPTAGLDPQSKRLIWNVLMGLFREMRLRNDDEAYDVGYGAASRCCCVFTSHSMEEVEAVCDRIGILIHGRLHCLGSIAHCKTKFGAGYTAEFKLRNATGLEYLWQYLICHFPNAEKVVSEVGNAVRINLPRADIKSLGKAFLVLEQAKMNPLFAIEDYAFGQCTLEQLFLDLVRKHDLQAL